MGDRYLGTWELVPELSLYQSGEPPRSGRYALESEGDALAVHIDWVDAQGEPGEASYGGPTDGSEIELDAPGAPRLTLQRVDDATLDSAVFVDGEQIAWARRRASTDGSLLSVVQSGTDAEGTAFRNFQVYRRVADD